MNGTFISYIQQLELIAFFAAYPLFYAIVSAVSGSKSLKSILKVCRVSHLPYSYALIATLYVALQFKNFYSADAVTESFRLPFMVIWGLLANLFWIRFLAKRPALSFWHSLVFFFPIAKDILLQTDSDILYNDMKLYTVSLTIHIVAFISVSLISALYRSSAINK
jgi:hypothetical protein